MYITIAAAAMAPEGKETERFSMGLGYARRKAWIGEKES
jgi:hypothetical protein